MNILLIDELGKPSAEDVFHRISKLTTADHIGLARTDDAGVPSILFDSGEGVFPTAPSEGPLPLVMLTCDQFDWDAELVILADFPTMWAAHLDRLAEQDQSELDAFFAFNAECEVGTGPTKLAPLLEISGTLAPNLVWFRETSRFYSLAQKAIRKDARVGGHFTFGSMVRELYLNHANVGYQCADRRPLRALTRVLEPILD